MDRIGFVGWIVSYRLDCIAGSYRTGWIGSYLIVSNGSGNTGFCALAVYCIYVMDGMDGLDGVLVGRGWDGRTLAGTRTGEPPLALEGW